MRWLRTVALLALTACASGGTRGGSGVNELLRRAGSLEVSPPRDGSEYFVVDTVAGTRERAFNAVRYTYEGLGIPFSYYDADRYQLGGFFRQLGELDHEPPSAWVRCGFGVPAGDNADLHYVILAIGTRVLPIDETTSTVETVVRARSHQRDVSSSTTRCATLGTLEERVARGARELLARYGPSQGRDPSGG